MLFLLMRRKLRITQVIILYLSILFLMMLSIVYTVSAELTTRFLLVMGYGGVLYIAVGEMNRAKEMVTRVLLTFSMMNVLITVASIFFPETFATVMSQLLPNVNAKFTFASGIMGQTGTNAYVICYGLLYWLILLSGNPKSKLKTIVLLALSLFALFLTGKRGPLIWVGATFLIVDLIRRKTMGEKNPLKRLWQYALLVAALMVFIAIIDSNELIQQTFDRFTVEEDGDFSSGRLELYKRAILIIKENVFLGIGAGAYNYYGIGAHNDYLQIFAENGLLCSALFFIFIGWNIKNAYQSYCLEKDVKSLYVLALQVFMALNALTGTSYLHFGFYFVFMELSAASYNDRITAAIQRRTRLTNDAPINRMG